MQARFFSAAGDERPQRCDNAARNLPAKAKE
jgi:hypothetical protein